MSLLFLHCSLFISSAAAQLRVEYFFDTDPGRRQATCVNVVPDADGNITFNAPTDGLTPGNHLLGLRAYRDGLTEDDEPLTLFGPTIIQQIFVPKSEDWLNITRLEYFWDIDPGFGNGTAIEITPDEAIDLDNIEIPTDGLSPGNHLLGLRAYGALGWSPSLTQQVYVAPKTNNGTDISRVEYFWDSDPGYGNGTPVAITLGQEVNLENLEISTEGLSMGEHHLFIRTFGHVGWSPTMAFTVIVPPSEANQRITAVEYFWDEDPGYGKATPFTITPGVEVDIDKVEVSTEGLSQGDHSLFIRSYGYDGWSPTIQATIRVLPMDADFVVNHAEYFWDEDPGFGKGTALTISEGQQVNTDGLGLSVSGLSLGEHQLFIRYHGPLGWSPTVVTDIINISDADLKVSCAEFFWNEDPGFGKGTPIALTPGETISLEDFQIPSSKVHGDAILFIRYRGPFGWSPTVAYPIMVDAEGNYTLDANAETSIETRNYQSLSDAVDDFSDRGVGNNITLNLPTTNTDYQLDATTQERLAQLAAISESIERVSTCREGKSIGFKATEASGNTLTVTTTDEGLTTVLEFFAHTWLENVTLTINGQAYNFSSWATTPHSEEVCSGVETTPVSISVPITGMTVSFTPQPYQGNALSGFATEASPTLPAMTIENCSAKLDSVAYRVALSDVQGAEISSFTYYIYIRPLVGIQQFSGMLPATGSSLDPGQTTLKWNAVPAAESYRLTVTDADNNIIEGFPVTTDKTCYELTVVSGEHYQWQVVAVGSCDELTSPTMTFSGRLLPDLLVSSITAPEAGEAGNTITVTATITNQGPGATIEGRWTDRLYYAVNSNDFALAVQAAEVIHNGNLDADGSYDVTFTMKVPYADAGTLHFFVVTDVAAKVMENDDDNNRMLSANAAQLQPFYMNTTDLAALRQLYDDFGGDQWNGTKWNTASELITEGNWSGVTFDTDGRVTAINLQGRGLTGELSGSTAPMLPFLTDLNLSHNALTGDVTPFVESLSLTSLNLSYNSIRNISAALPTTITTLNVGNQSLADVLEFDLAKMIDDDFLCQLPTIVRYNHTSRNYDSDIKLRCVSPDGVFMLTRANGTSSVSSSSKLVYKEASGETVDVSSQSGLATGTTFQMSLSFPQGDATFNGETNILDLQATINYMFSRWNDRLFNYAAANLYPDAIINIQDAIRLIDVIINEPWYDGPNMPIHPASLSRRKASADTQAQLYVEGDILRLSTTVPVAAMDIVLSDCSNVSNTDGLTTSGLSINTKRTDSSLRLIAYSFSDGTLPTGETELCRISGNSPRVICAKLADANANEVTVSVSDVTTAVNSASQPVAFKLYSTAGLLVASGDTSDMQTAIDHLPTGIYVLRQIFSDGMERQSKIRIESR